MSTLYPELLQKIANSSEKRVSEKYNPLGAAVGGFLGYKALRKPQPRLIAALGALLGMGIGSKALAEVISEVHSKKASEKQASKITELLKRLKMLDSLSFGGPRSRVLIELGLPHGGKITELLKRYKSLLRGGNVKDLKAVDRQWAIGDLHALKSEQLKVLLAQLGTGAGIFGAGAATGAAAYKSRDKRLEKKAGLPSAVMRGGGGALGKLLRLRRAGGKLGVRTQNPGLQKQIAAFGGAKPSANPLEFLAAKERRIQKALRGKLRSQKALKKITEPKPIPQAKTLEELRRAKYPHKYAPQTTPLTHEQRLTEELRKSKERILGARGDHGTARLSFSGPPIRRESQLVGGKARKETEQVGRQVFGWKGQGSKNPKYWE